MSFSDHTLIVGIPHFLYELWPNMTTKDMIIVKLLYCMLFFFYTKYEIIIYMILYMI